MLIQQPNFWGHPFNNSFSLDGADHKTTRYWQTTIRRSEDRADLMCKVPKAARWFYLLRARP